MQLTKKIQKAIDTASRLHFGQTRKNDATLPYIIHPFCVAWILANYTEDESIIIAGLLHDTLEDVKNYRFNDLKEDFGEKIALIVKEVSEDKDPNFVIDEKATWDDRKKGYIENLKNDNFEALMVCAADKIHNLQSMNKAFSELGKKMWDEFNAPPEKTIWFYESVTKILNDRLDNEIIVVLNNELELFRKIIHKE